LSLPEDGGGVRKSRLPDAVNKPMAAPTVESLCNSLAKSKLLSAGDVKAVYQRWRAEGRDAVAQTDKFLRWLVHRQYVTEYQANLLSRGQIDNFFLFDYKILDRIGAGRMAGVFKAIHTKGAVVAVKVLPPSKARNLELFSRFQREARMALKLKHPNIVRTFQVAECRGLHFLVMEYLDGEPLDDVLKKRGKLPPVEAVRIVYQALLGLQHIHEQGMIHRDLKPGNLMLVPVPPAPSTAGSSVKILDIGLGKVMFDEEVPGGLEQVQLTTDGAILGAPEYMAPEQAKDAHAADIRSDIYSLGCVLYHCLAGQSPFYDVNPVRIMVKQASEAPRPLREVNPQVPDSLQQIINRMLAKDPNQRFQTPAQAAQALHAHLSGGAEAGRGVEADPSMHAYLAWLNTQPAPGEAGSPPVAAAPPARMAPATPTPPPGWSPPQGRPVAPPPAPVGISPSEADVELVPVGPAPAGKKPRLPPLAPSGPPSEADTDLGRRDVLLLGVVVGIALVVVAGGVAFLIHMFLRRG
jgi:hypothetical protein